ncbi:sporangiospore maturation cell wall hydrolase GsmA [Glycomyces xiaoerkulensis]|uniref:sporangiospore maturation cell wall hydrolase GsmA n=1 Tax=Glycomyces xiaoerkulensis TaxID=2038139 RepID=UPI000C255C7A|nr:sporangiospore maturation cell wall hydrolase GsmA [Glycomyces xiaoerkulensis]
MGAYIRRFRVIAVTALAAGLLPGAAPAAVSADAAVSTDGGAVNVRSGPATDERILGTLADGDSLTAACKARGEHIAGHVRDTSTWLRIGSDRWISHAYVGWDDEPTDLRWCSTAGEAATAARVATDGLDLNIRAGATTAAAVHGTAANASRLDVRCQQWGQEIDGRVERTHLWYRIDDERYVSGAYVEWTAGRPWLAWCGQDPPTVPRGGERAFIDTHAPAARAGQEATGVPASVTLAQAILETGWGESPLAREDHNLFGMKCFGSPGEHAVGCRDYGTFECGPTGGCYGMDATFRAYATVGDSYRDHGELLSTWSRYAEAMEHRDDPDRFAREIHRAGYATDPDYADKLIGLMRQHDLYEHDRAAH